MSKSLKNVKYLSIKQTKKPTLQSQSTRNTDEERDSPEAIIDFIHKKFHFKSKFDKKGSEEFLSSKDIALYDVILDDQIEEDDKSASCNNLSFMEKFTFNKEFSSISDEINFYTKNQKNYPSEHNLNKSYQLCDNY